MLGRLDRHADLVAAMSRRAGIDLGARIGPRGLRAEEYRRAIFSCVRCDRADACRTHLATEGSDVPGYCRNKTLLDGLARA